MLTDDEAVAIALGLAAGHRAGMVTARVLGVEHHDPGRHCRSGTYQGTGRDSLAWKCDVGNRIGTEIDLFGMDTMR